MNQSVVLAADKPGSNSAAICKVAGMAPATKAGKCIPLSAPLVAKRHRYLSSPEKGDLCTAATVTLKLGARVTFSKDYTKGEDDTGNHPT